MAGLFARRAPALLRAGYSTASGDVGAEARITWIEGNMKCIAYTVCSRMAIITAIPEPNATGGWKLRTAIRLEQ
jgi:hypothetical protein